MIIVYFEKYTTYVVPIYVDSIAQGLTHYCSPNTNITIDHKLADTILNRFAPSNIQKQYSKLFEITVDMVK